MPQLASILSSSPHQREGLDRRLMKRTALLLVLCDTVKGYHVNGRTLRVTLDRFNVHRCPTRWVFSGTGLEHVTKPATIRYLYHSATAAREDFVLEGFKVHQLLCRASLQWHWDWNSRHSSHEFVTMNTGLPGLPLKLQLRGITQLRC
ncbi:hypothetical protein TNCV_3420671 [Trichonephila clavipes]|nr:hypothetical protein TNCV_3420671 [Trichonephila clavipes]